MTQVSYNSGEQQRFNARFQVAYRRLSTLAADEPLESGILLQFPNIEKVETAAVQPKPETVAPVIPLRRVDVKPEVAGAIITTTAQELNASEQQHANDLAAAQLAVNQAIERAA